MPPSSSSASFSFVALLFFDVMAAAASLLKTLALSSFSVEFRIFMAFDHEHAAAEDEEELDRARERLSLYPTVGRILKRLAKILRIYFLGIFSAMEVY